MNILLTNDDGIDAAGLRVLAGTAISRGHTVIVSAPAKQQSAASQRITLNAPLMVERKKDFPGAEAWAVDGTPTDCVRLGLELSGMPVDVCMSGINDGENAGSAAFYSGTVSAAREAAMHHIPAFAVSIMPGADREMLAALAERTIAMAEKADLSALPRLSVVSINAPALPADSWKGPRFCPLSRAFYRDRYERRQSPRGRDYFWLNNGLPMEDPEPGSAYDLLRQGYLTVAVIGGFEEMNARAHEFLSPDD